MYIAYYKIIDVMELRKLITFRKWKAIFVAIGKKEMVKHIPGNLFF